MTALRGDRVLLRGWRDDDLDAFAAPNADPRVMEYFPKLLSRDETAAMTARMQAAIDARGWGNWVLDINGRCVGLSVPALHAHVTPCTEIDWRLSFDACGHGYATEAARPAPGFGVDELQLTEIGRSHGGRQPALPARHAADRHAPQRRRRL